MSSTIADTLATAFGSVVNALVNNVVVPYITGAPLAAGSAAAVGWAQALFAFMGAVGLYLVNQLSITTALITGVASAGTLTTTSSVVGATNLHTISNDPTYISDTTGNIDTSSSNQFMTNQNDTSFVLSASVLGAMLLALSNLGGGKTTLSNSGSTSFTLNPGSSFSMINANGQWSSTTSGYT